MNYGTCENCPFYRQKNLASRPLTIKTPLYLRNGKNDPKDLIIFKYPGICEAMEGRAVVSSKKKGCMTERLKDSWLKFGKTEEDFDITYFIKCYKGENNRKIPKSAIALCSQKLRNELKKKKYERIFVIGKEFYSYLKKIFEEEKIDSEIIYIFNLSTIKINELDDLWTK
jgi:uracil-DNA glycosylase